MLATTNLDLHQIGQPLKGKMHFTKKIFIFKTSMEDIWLNVKRSQSSTIPHPCVARSRCSISATSSTKHIILDMKYVLSILKVLNT